MIDERPNQQPDAFAAGTQKAIDRHFADITTKAMTIVELAEIFGLDRNKTAKMLRRMEGTERVDSLWRVPIRKMPPNYWLEQGLIKPVAPICTDLHD